MFIYFFQIFSSLPPHFLSVVSGVLFFPPIRFSFFFYFFSLPLNTRGRKKKEDKKKCSQIDETPSILPPHFFFILFYLFFSLLNYAGSLENHLIAIQNFINRLFVLFINPHHVNTPNSLFFFLLIYIFFLYFQDFFFYKFHQIEM